MIRVRPLLALCALSLMGCAVQPEEAASSSTAALSSGSTPEATDGTTPKGAPSGAQSPDPEGDDPSEPHPSPWLPPGEAESEPHPSPWNPNEAHVVSAALGGR